MRNLVLGRLPQGWVLGCVMSFVAVPVMGSESLPASVRACAAVTDSLQRLVCYDREVAKFPAPAAKAEKSAPGAGGAAASGGSADVTSGSAVATTPGPAAVTRPPAAAGTTSAPASANNSAPAANSGSTSVAIASSDDHIIARIVSIDRQPNEMVLHLDNGQVWQEVQSISGDLSLREGDAVKIDRHFGSFWLTGPHVSSMKVQRKT